MLLELVALIGLVLVAVTCMSRKSSRRDERKKNSASAISRFITKLNSGKSKARSVFGSSSVKVHMRLSDPLAGDKENFESIPSKSITNRDKSRHPLGDLVLAPHYLNTQNP